MGDSRRKHSACVWKKNIFFEQTGLSAQFPEALFSQNSSASKEERKYGEGEREKQKPWRDGGGSQLAGGARGRPAGSSVIRVGQALLQQTPLLTGTRVGTPTRHWVPCRFGFVGDEGWETTWFWSPLAFRISCAFDQAASVPSCPLLSEPELEPSPGTPLRGAASALSISSSS